MTETAYFANLGRRFWTHCNDHAQWSDATFGPAHQRGPIGPLKHLEREAREAQANPTDPSEYADCLLLVLDAARRIGIHGPQLLNAAIAKLEVDKARHWPQTSSDEPVEHERGTA